MKVVPVPFSTEGKNMLIHTKELLEFETPIVAINPKFEKLTTSLGLLSVMTWANWTKKLHHTITS